MGDEPGAFWAGVLVTAVVLMGVVLYGIGWQDGAKTERERAVKVGAARWETDPTTGERRFVYGVVFGVKAGGTMR